LEVLTHLTIFLDVAKLIFGEKHDDKIVEYVDGVFQNFDDNHSGVLSFDESREFVFSLVNFFDKDGRLSAEEKANLLSIISSKPEEAESEDFSKTEIEKTEVSVTKTVITAEKTEIKITNKAETTKEDVPINGEPATSETELVAKTVVNVTATSKTDQARVSLGRPKMYKKPKNTLWRN